MKRTEMFVKIFNTLTQVYPELKVHPDFYLIAAENVLNVIEDAGMLPSPYVNPELGDHMNFYEINQWEEE